MPDHAALRALAAGQGGVFTPAQAMECGWTHHGVLKVVEAGLWRRLHRGILVDDAWLESLDATGRHLVLVQARLMHRPQGWHAARRTAALVHQLPIIGAPPIVPQLVRDKSDLRLRGSVRHERISTLPAEERTEGLVPVTSLARTVADIARDECFRNAVVVADAALRSGATVEELLHVAHRCSGWPGGAATKPVAIFADGLSETPLESISRVAFHQLQLPVPELQVEIWQHAEFLGRVDFLWRNFNVVGEADGRSKYGSVDDFYRRSAGRKRYGTSGSRWCAGTGGPHTGRDRISKQHSNALSPAAP